MPPFLDFRIPSLEGRTFKEQEKTSKKQKSLEDVQREKTHERRTLMGPKTFFRRCSELRTRVQRGSISEMRQNTKLVHSFH
jgi:hypothetical protein